MSQRPLRRAAALALTAALAFAGTVAADTVQVQGDTVTPGPQPTIVLADPVAPGATVDVAVPFALTCTGTAHLDPGQVMTLTAMSATSAPPGGAVVSVGAASVGPVSDGWPADGATCPTGLAPLVGTTSAVRLRAPLTPNLGYVYTIGYTRSLAPAGNDDSGAIGTRVPSVAIRLDVAEPPEDTPPTVTSDGDRTVEGETAGGWLAAYPDVTVTDVEDDPAPTATCQPAAGSVLPLGTTTVTCSATDSAGQTGSTSFAVTVADTTPPVLGPVDDVTAETTDPAGVPVAFAVPGATDIVDPAPAVGCDPASGSTFPVASTLVTCTAVDAAGNAASTTFTVRVDLLPTVVAAASWGEPVGVAEGGTFVANRGRTVPVKVTITVDGVVRTTGEASLSIAPCGGGKALDLALAYGGGR